MNKPDTTEPPLISLRGVTKRYGEGQASFLALRGVDLDIWRGQFVAAAENRHTRGARHRQVRCAGRRR